MTMTHQPLFRTSHGRITPRRVVAGIVTIVFAAIAMIAVFLMEARFSGLETTRFHVGDTPVTLLQTLGDEPAPLVLVTHGFGGSRQMMDQIAVSLARQGFATALMDFPGHGRHTGALSRDVTRIEGTTMQLVEETTRVAKALLERDDIEGPISLVGHSMATDVIIRAAQGLENVGAVIAISMYSPAVSAGRPSDLLIISGQSEAHLREAALDAVRLVASDASEGAVIETDEIRRAALVAPWVGHVGVLYHDLTLTAARDWIGETLGQPASAPVDRTGPITLVLLAALMALCWRAAQALPRRSEPAPQLSKRMSALVILAPLVPCIAVPMVLDLGLFGLAGFGTLAAFLAFWGIVQLLILRRAGLGWPAFDGLGAAVLVAMGLVFALALDRYGAHFLPSGPRMALWAGLAIACLPLMLAEAMFLTGASIWRRLAARSVLIIGLGAAMGLAPTELGLTFTVLPVLVLFFLVYGSFARWVAARRGAGALAVPQALALGWAIAASTPLFSVGGLG